MSNIEQIQKLTTVIQSMSNSLDNEEGKQKQLCMIYGNGDIEIGSGSSQDKDKEIGWELCMNKEESRWGLRNCNHSWILGELRTKRLGHTALTYFS